MFRGVPAHAAGIEVVIAFLWEYAGCNLVPEGGRESRAAHAGHTPLLLLAQKQTRQSPLRAEEHRIDTVGLEGYQLAWF